MSDNPLEATPARDQRIRERAYHLWDSEGRPVGRDLDYWERASELEAMAANSDSGLLPNPMVAHPEGPPATLQPVEEASIMENLGEFPDRSADQGERRLTPMTRPDTDRTSQDG